MKVLLIGSGGREHAMAESICKSKNLDNLFILPGNFGTKEFGENIDIDLNDNSKIIEFVKENKIDLTFVGPEVPIMNGIADAFAKEGLKVFAPLKNAGQIEGSKSFAKSIMEKYNIPTGNFKEFTNYENAIDYVKNMNIYPTVIKYDGLAAGKGVYIHNNFEDTTTTLKDLLNDKSLGEDTVIIEEFLEGDEFTLMAFVDGEKVYPMPIARDFKRIFNEDKGNNTGGMGCICPYDKISSQEKDEAIKILNDTAKALVKEGLHYTGILYGGFIATKDGVKVIEFNARFGDPETEVVLQKIKTSILDIADNILENKDVNIELNENTYTGVVLTAKGYPDSYIKNVDMSNFLNTNFTTYHMSTIKKNEKIVSTGGRVLCITNNDKDSVSSFNKIYNVIKDIKNDNIHYRTDLNKY